MPDRKRNVKTMYNIARLLRIPSNDVVGKAGDRRGVGGEVGALNSSRSRRHVI